MLKKKNPKSAQLYAWKANPENGSQRLLKLLLFNNTICAGFSFLGFEFLAWDKQNGKF